MKDKKILVTGGSGMVGSALQQILPEAVYVSSQDFDSSDHITPGRKRIISNSKRESIDWEFNQDTIDQESLKIGSKVFHTKFGHGKILFIEGDKAKVDFKKSSTKQVFLKFLQITD